MELLFENLFMVYDLYFGVVSIKPVGNLMVYYNIYLSEKGGVHFY